MSGQCSATSRYGRCTLAANHGGWHMAAVDGDPLRVIPFGSDQ